MFIIYILAVIGIIYICSVIYFLITDAAADEPEDMDDMEDMTNEQDL